MRRVDAPIATFCDTYTLERMRRVLSTEFPETRTVLEAAVPARYFRVFAHFCGTICIHDAPIVYPSTLGGLA